MSESASRFVVSRVEWAPPGYEERYYRRTPRTESVATFATFEQADNDRAAREAERRKAVNPFCHGGEALFYQTSLGAPQLHDWLMDAGIDPPSAPKAHADWIAWWDLFAPSWSAEQLAHAWAALDKIRFFEVTEERADRKAYVVVELNWKWEDEPTLEADYEGGNMVKAFRSRAAAEAECERLNRERQAQEEHKGYSSFTRYTRVGEKGAPSLGIAETIFFEVVEIDLGEP
ncbi:MAG: hypothetical protein K2V38_01880, partial [Gemmataceae bacterium]|nr:hypothetical protein [Gemmataceae bacterium]